jgi:predicted amidohydrolase YtcJ
MTRLSATLATLLGGMIATAQAAPADALFINANVYTANDRQPQAEAIATKGDRIVFVGSNAEAEKFRGEGTRVVDLAGRTVLPGLTDAHCHIFGIGERELTLNLEGTNSREAFLAKVEERVRETPPGKWITGRGWIETFWQPPQFPTRADLDKIAPDHPVLLTRADGHAAIANSAALKIAGVTGKTEPPFGGDILKENGEPTGMLIDGAQELVQRHVPKPTEADREEALRVAAERETRLGWTQVHNAGGEWADAQLIRRAIGSGKVKLRIYNAVYGPGDASAKLLEQGPVIGEHDHRFTFRTVKVMFDGALGSRGAALLEPYSDRSDTAGFLRAKEADLKKFFAEALRRGIQVQTHAIGDRANRILLDLYDEAFKAVPPENRKVKEPRWRVEHAQVVVPADIPRFAKMGVIASMQPSHAISDLFFAPSRLGQERLAGAYAWKSFLDTGAVVAGGSDAPVERGEPMIEFYAAVARKSLQGESKEGWHPEQAVTREQALKMFTIAPAFAAFEEKERGTIEVGKLADLTVLSDDIMKIDEPKILETQCVMTVIGGDIVYSAL